MPSSNDFSQQGLSQQSRFTKLIIPGGFSSAGPGQNSRADRDGDPREGGAAGSGERIVFNRFDGTEGLSQLFDYRVDVLSPERNIDFTTLIGTNLGVSYTSYGRKQRYFNGVVADAQWLGPKEEKHLYKLVLRPWLWMLGRRSNCKIFKNKTVPDIIKAVFDDNGFNDYQFSVQHSFKPAEYIVQYMETDLAFVMRLMEEWGIYFYFEHKENKHVLHLIDSKNLHPKIAPAMPDDFNATASYNDSTSGSRRTERSSGSTSSASEDPTGIVLYRELTARDRREQEHIYAWQAERRFQTGKVELRDYDYLNARKQLTGTYQGSEGYSHHDLESYSYRGRWADSEDEGTHLAQVKLEAEQAGDHRKFASGDAASLYPGGYFQLVGHPTDDDEYLVIRASHSFVSQEYRAGGQAEEEVYRGQYEVQPNSRPFRAPFVTPKARIYGPQTAFVVARDGVAASEEIDVDDKGRIVVNFHWNRGDKNKDCSRDVRVAQLWAGKGWGWQFIPRIGMEVVVEFLDGDPDQPLVTGCVYNSDFPYPYTMPANKTQSGVKTDSTIDSGNDAYNELRFEDKKGSEEVYFRAEKDHNTLIQNVETRKVLNHQETYIGEKFQDSIDVHSGLSRVTDVINGSDMLSIENGNRHVSLDKGDHILWITKGDRRETIENGKASTYVSGGDYRVDVVGPITLAASESITFEINGGQTKITMDPSGITLKGPMININ